MLKSILSGGFWGFLVAGVVLGTASLVADQPAGSRPPVAPPVDAPGGPDLAPPPVASRQLPARPADAGGAPQPSVTPQVSVDTASAPVSNFDTTPLASPDAAQATAGLEAPVLADAAPIAADTEAPVLPNPQAAPPQVPAQEADVRLETTTPPLPEPQPEVVTVTDPDAAPEDPQGEAATAPLAGTDVPDPVAADDLTGADPEGQPDAGVVIVATPEPIDDARPDRPTAPETDPALPNFVIVADDVVPTQPEISADPVPASPAEGMPDEEPPVAGPTDGSTGSAPPVSTEAQEIIVLTDPDPDLEATGTDPGDGPRIALQGDAATLPGSGAAVRIGRPDDLPAETADPAEIEADSGSTEIPTVDPDVPALVRYAAPLDNPDDRPLVAVILIDDGSLGDAVAAVAGVPFDVTVALDPTTSGAADRMAEYRAAGIEVMALARVPVGATPSDAEVALEAAFAQLSEAVGLLDVGDTDLQDDPDVVAQAMARLSADGRGYVTASQGLNSALRAAETASVPSGLIYRELDGEDQSAQVIRRFLDQAAFRAGQQSGVILLGRVRGDTLSALTLWGAANRSGQVTLAPISHVLGAP